MKEGMIGIGWIGIHFLHIKEANMSNNQISSKTKVIKIGKFYLIHDGSKTGHPGLVIWKDDEKNRYLVIRTDSDKPGKVTKVQKGEKHITKLKHPTDNTVINSYVHNRPMMCKRKDIGNKELIGMSFHMDDKTLIDDISKRNPEYTPTFNKK